jgi:ATP adenylyltransferase
MDYIWAGWRSAFFGSTSHEGCVLCAIGASLDLDDHLVVAKGLHSFCVLNLYPYTSGHLMIVPLRHVKDPIELDRDELSSLNAGVLAALQALRSAYQPEGINIGMNLGKAAGAGIADHMHVHVVPRWIGDANFMTSSALARVLPEALPETLEKVRRNWPERTQF